MDEFLKVCRYYKGEEDCPFNDQDRSMLWFYERSWVLDMENDRFEKSLIGDYIYVGLSGFANNDNTPLTLKALLFNRFCKGVYSMADAVEPFKNMYLKFYGEK